MSEQEETPDVPARCFQCRTHPPIYGLQCKRDLIVPMCAECLGRIMEKVSGEGQRTRKREG
jgi:hypothetical protein